MRNFLRDVLGALILAGVIFFTLQITLQTFVIVGPCMEPGLQSGQRILINKIAYAFGEPERGDVIIFTPPDNPEGDPFIKRIIALPGESVEIKQGKVYIYKNGNVIELNEPHYIDPPRYTYDMYTVPENEYFVLGDNRNIAYDSHSWGTLPRQNIIGKAWLRIWPLDEWGVLPSYTLEEQLASAASE